MPWVGLSANPFLVVPMDIKGFRFGREVGRALRVVIPEGFDGQKADPTSFSAEPKPIWSGTPAVLNFADRPTQGTEYRRATALQSLRRETCRARGIADGNVPTREHEGLSA